jgi:hypothetical protein
MSSPFLCYNGPMFNVLKSHSNGRRKFVPHTLIGGECTREPLRGLISNLKSLRLGIFMMGKMNFAKRTQIGKLLTASKLIRNAKNSAKLTQKTNPKRTHFALFAGIVTARAGHLIQIKTLPKLIPD